MAIAFDAASNSGYQSGVSTYSWSHTCTGNSGFLAVDVGFLSVAGTTVSSITYNGVNLTLIGAKNTPSGAGRIENWGLKNPSIGANTIVVTLSATVVSAAVAVSYTGVSQPTSNEAFAGNSAINSGSPTNSTVVITSVNSNVWVHAALATVSTSVTSSQTSRNNVSGVLGSVANADTNGTIGALVAQTMTYTGEGVLDFWTIAGYCLVPVGLALVQKIDQETGNSGSARTLATPSNITAGNLIVITVATFNVANLVSMTVTDSLGNTYIPSPGNGALQTHCQVWSFYAYNVTGGACTVTVTPVSSCYMTLLILEYSGESIYYPLDNALASTFSSTTTPSAGTTQIPNSNELVLAIFVQGSGSFSTTVGTGFVKRLDYTNNSNIPCTVEEQNAVGSSLNPGLTYSSSASGSIQVLVFRPAPTVTATITPVQGQVIGTQRTPASSSSLVLTYPKATAGTPKLLVAIIAHNGPSTTVTVTDNKGNTWTRAVTANDVSNVRVEIWYVINGSGGSNHQVTITPNASVILNAAINEYTGSGGTVALSNTNTGTGSSTTPNSGNVTTTVGGYVYIGACSHVGGISYVQSENGWNNIFNYGANNYISTYTGIGAECLGDITIQGATTVAATWTLTSTAPWAAAIATFGITVVSQIDHLPILGVS